MKIAVVGLWHLGCVTAACLAKAGFSVVAYDGDHQVIEDLNHGKAPIFEPGLNELIASGLTANTLRPTHDQAALAEANIVWITIDTPVDDHDVADVDYVVNQVTALFPVFSANTLVLISSQVPVGTTRRLQKMAAQQYPQKHLTFACSPENLRLGKAIDVFTHPDRVVVGLETMQDQARVQALFAPFTDQIVWMSIESAEMTKHALNAFLATSVVFINELSTLCEQVGADAREVERGLKSEERIGPKAYLRPGSAIAGGTLARDVNYLIQIGQQKHTATPLFSALLDSNQAHKQWSCNRILQVLKDLRGKVVTVLGLTYKVGTDTLRRSQAVETCEWLASQGVTVKAYDPSLQALPNTLTNYIQLEPSLDSALNKADAVVVSTEWPQFQSLTVEALLNTVSQPLVFDASGFLMKTLGMDKRVQYYSVGRQT